MIEPSTLVELDDIEFQLGELLEQLTQAAIALENVGAFDGGYLEFDDERLSMNLACAQYELEDAMQMVEDAINSNGIERRKEEEGL